jgi:hypothetical protein
MKAIAVINNQINQEQKEKQEYREALPGINQTAQTAEQHQGIKDDRDRRVTADEFRQLYYMKQKIGKVR